MNREESTEDCKAPWIVLDKEIDSYREEKTAEVSTTKDNLLLSPETQDKRKQGHHNTDKLKRKIGRQRGAVFPRVNTKAEEQAGGQADRQENSLRNSRFHACKLRRRTLTSRYFR